MRIKTILLYGCLLHSAISFAQTQKSVVGRVISMNAKNQTDTIQIAAITYSDDSLMQGRNPYRIKNNRTSSILDGRFGIEIPDADCGNSFIVVEMMGYEPEFIDPDMLTANCLTVNLRPKVYDISVTYSSDTVYWKCGNLKEYSYALVYPGGEDDIEAPPLTWVDTLMTWNPYHHEFPTIMDTDTLGEQKLVPEPETGYTKWFERIVSEGNISGTVVIEITVNRNPVEINCLSGRIGESGLDFIRRSEWKVPHRYSGSWMRRSYNPPGKVSITFTEME